MDDSAIIKRVSSAARASSAGAGDQLEAQIDDAVGNRTSGGAIDDEACRLAADRGAVDAYRRKRRMRVGGEVVVAEAEDAQPPRDLDAARLGFDERAQRQD